MTSPSFVLHSIVIAVCLGACCSPEPISLKSHADQSLDNAAYKPSAAPYPVKTYAELEAALARNTALFERSQLTANPERYLDDSDLNFSLFYRLPLDERVVAIMASFKNEELDGEYAEMMWGMLSYRHERNNYIEPVSSFDFADRAYTRAIFRMIDSYSDAQIRAFCGNKVSYARFQKNLKIWKKRVL